MRILTRREIEVLGTYNAEVARGIVHTDLWNKKMADLQESFDMMQKIDAKMANVRR